MAGRHVTEPGCPRCRVPRRCRMFATVRELHFVPEKLAAGRAQVQEFTAFFDTRPGCRGQIVVDAGAGRMLALEVWESEAHCLASHDEVEREAGRSMHAMLADGP